MRTTLMPVLALFLFSLLFFAACGEEESKGVTPLVVNGTLGGCEVMQQKPGLRVGAFGELTGGALFEITSTSATYPDPFSNPSGKTTYTLTFDKKPGGDVNWITLDDGKTKRAEFMLYTYIDENGDEAFYSFDNESRLYAADVKIYYYTADFQGAVKGYNIYSSGLYTTDYTTVNSDALFIKTSTGDCADGDVTDGDEETPSESPEAEQGEK